MKKDQIYKNKLVKKIIDENVLLAKRTHNTKEGREHLSEREKFLVDTFHAFTEITSKFDALESCLALISSYPKTQLWSKNFTRAEYVRYHLEAYYSNLIGIFDRYLLLVNHVYDLGLEPGHVKYELILKNSHIKGTEVQKVLKAINKGLQNIRSVRNLVAHRGRLADQRLDEIDRVEFILSKSKNLSKKESQIFRVYVKLKFSVYLSAKKKEIKLNNAEIFRAFDTAFLTLLPKYNKRLATYPVSKISLARK